jgi:hypothetical protein
MVTSNEPCTCFFQPARFLNLAGYASTILKLTVTNAGKINNFIDYNPLPVN